MGNGMMTMSNAMVTAVLNKGLWGSGSHSHKGGKDEALKEKNVKKYSQDRI